jgi:SAM-dependent methyltransferase
MLHVPEHLHRNHPAVHAHGPEHTGEVLIRLATRLLGLVSLATADVLDVGCGVRFAQALLNRGIPIGSYTGVDVHGPLIEFLRQDVTNPRFRFALWDVHNELYNPTGPPLRADMALPVEGSFDVIWLFSVCTHMPPAEVDALLAIFRRAIRPQGGLFFSAFVDDTVEDFAERLPEFPGSRPTYAEPYLRRMLARNGWQVESSHPASDELFIQHHFVCRPVKAPLAEP